MDFLPKVAEIAETKVEVEMDRKGLTILNGSKSFVQKSFDLQTLGRCTVVYVFYLIFSACLSVSMSLFLCICLSFLSFSLLSCSLSFLPQLSLSRLSISHHRITLYFISLVISLTLSLSLCVFLSLAVSLSLSFSRCLSLTFSISLPLSHYLSLIISSHFLSIFVYF